LKRNPRREVVVVSESCSAHMASHLSFL